MHVLFNSSMMFKNTTRLATVLRPSFYIFFIYSQTVTADSDPQDLGALCVSNMYL